MIIDDRDKVYEDHVYDYKDNPYDILDQNPVRVTSYVEELKGGKFKQIYNKAVKGLIDNNQEQLGHNPSSIEHMEIDLMEIIIYSRSFLGRFFLFFQGLTSGLSLIHIYLLYINGDTNSSSSGGFNSVGAAYTTMNNYSYQALRLNQLFQLCFLLCTVGSVDKLLFLKNKCEELSRSQSHGLIRARKNYIRTVISAIVFFLGYALVTFNHQTVAALSANYNSANIANYSSQFTIFQVLSIAVALLSFIGWYTVVTIHSEQQQGDTDLQAYTNLTEDSVQEKEELL
jgi:hypothetical protein